MKKIKTLCFAPLVLTLLAGCHSQSKDERYNNLSAIEIYQTGVTHIDKHNYAEAIDDFSALESRYPFGDYAEKAQLGVIYAYYLNEDYTSAIPAVDRFLRMYPRDPHVDYVYYMKGLIHFNESLGFFGKYLKGNEERDPTSAREGIQAFSMLVSTFPDSIYAADATLRLVYLRNVLAAHELVAARYYMRKCAYVAAINRANVILTEFDQSPSMPEALAIMVEGYRALELPELAQDSYKILVLNYPGSNLIEALDSA